MMKQSHRRSTWKMKVFANQPVMTKRQVRRWRRKWIARIMQIKWE